MKRISCFLLLSTLLASCATSARYSFGSVVTPTPVVTEINAPTATAVFTPTSQPTPTLPETTAFLVDALTIAPEQAAAMKVHSGLEASIVAEAEGKFSASVQVLNQTGQPVTETMQVDPNTLHEDLASKNKYGDTPVMTTIDGKKLYWVQEEKAWFAVEISPDINKPVFVPFDQREVALRAVIAEFSQPFSQAALDRWKISPGLDMGFQYLTVNAKTSEGTRFGYLENPSMMRKSLTKDNSPIQVLDAWFTTSLPDGTEYQFFPTKWLDPLRALSPNGDEWKIIFVASGREIMGDEANRVKFDKILTDASKPGSKLSVVPIFKADSNFFNSTNGLITFMQAQPSLQKLFSIRENDMSKLPNPGHDNNPYSYTFDFHFANLTADNPSIVVAMGPEDPKYVNGFFPENIQTILFPSLIISR